MRTQSLCRVLFLFPFLFVAMALPAAAQSGGYGSVQVQVTPGRPGAAPANAAAAQAAAAQAMAAKRAAENKPNGKPDATKGKDSSKKDASSKPDAEKSGDAGPIKRPTTAPNQVDASELDVEPDESGHVRINFKGQSWLGILQWLSRVSGMSLDWQELPSDFLNLTTRRPYTVPEARDLINMHLLARGYTILISGEIMSVVKTKDINISLVPRVSADGLAERSPHEFVKVTFVLKTLLAGEATEELKPYISSNGKILALSSTNRIEVIDAVNNLRDIRTLLQAEQSDQGQQRTFRKFECRYTRAIDVVTSLKELLGMPASSGPAASPSNPQQAQQMQQMMQQMRQMQQQAQQKGKKPPSASGESKVHLVVLQRENAFLANATPDKLAYIEKALEAIDVPGRQEGSLIERLTRVHIYRLLTIDPEPLVETLRNVGNLAPETNLEIDSKNKAIIAYATLADHAKVHALISKLDGNGREFKVIPLRRLDAEYVAGSIEFMMGEEKEEENNRNPFGFFSFGRSNQKKTEDKGNKFRVEADVNFNRLLVYANENELEQVEDLLTQLGEIRVPGSNQSRTRIISAEPGEETQQILERIQRAWQARHPDVPLELDIPITAPGSETNKSDTKKTDEEKPGSNTDHVTSGNRTTFLPSPHSSGRAVRSPEVTLRRSSDGKITLVQFPLEQNFSGGPFPNNEQRPAAERKPPAVRITLGPEGLILTSDDPAALDELEDIIFAMMPPADDYKIYALQFASAYWVADTLEEIFEEKKDNDRGRGGYYYYRYYGGNSNEKSASRLSNRKPLKFVSDPDSNSILVQGGTTEQIHKVEELIKYYDRPEKRNSTLVHRQVVFQIKYSKASEVAETIKEVYRDLLSSNDKAFENKKGGQKETTRYYFDSWGDGDDNSSEERAPKFKGLISIGINEISNTLVVSAPDFMLKNVSVIIEQLDEAAKPTSTVSVLKTNPALKGEEARAALARLLGNKAAGKSEKRPDGERGDKSRKNRQKNGNNGNGDNGDK